MEAIKQIIRIPKNHEIKIKIPNYLSENDLIEVILIFKNRRNTFFKEKINELKKAMEDPLFLKDLEDISSDFETIDLEGWG